jgi:DNA helicase-2/ATP-dependent DNA helicase PcrA
LEVAWRDHLLISSEEMARLFNETYSYLPWARRLDKIRRRALFLLEPLESRRRAEVYLQLLTDPELTHLKKRGIRRRAIQETWAEFRELRGKLEEWAAFDAVSAYTALFRDDELFGRAAAGICVPEDIDAIRRVTVSQLARGRIPYEDLPGLLLLQGISEGFPVRHDIKQVIVDEAQDYTELQYEILGCLFPGSRFTLLGDLEQAIHPYAHLGGYETIRQVLPAEETVIVQLHRTYRSTREIVDFTRALLGDPRQVQCVNRPGRKPLVVKVDGPGAARALVRDIQSLQTEGSRSIAVICRTARRCIELHKRLHEKVDVELLTTDNYIFTGGTAVLPSYLAKGLEFDAVLVYEAGAGSYSDEGERRLFYMVCSRALHHLHIYYSDSLSRFVREVAPELYTHVVC